MRLALPLKATSFTVYEVESRRRELKLAVRVMDEFTQANVITPVRVSLSRKMAGGTMVEEKPVRNHAGHFCFEDLVDGNYVLVTEPDPVLDYYFLHPEQNQPWTEGFSREVAIPKPGGPEIVITLTPKPGYPFPLETTLVRGLLVDKAKTGVNRALVSATYVQSRPTLGNPAAAAVATAETRTDKKGYFTLFFGPIRRTPTFTRVVATEGGRRVAKTVTLEERKATIIVEPPLTFP
jgi:hypothetical protein